MLCRRACGDREAVHAFLTSHLRLVVKIAMGHRGYDLPISEGNVGLMKALKRFEPQKGFRLSTYATCWMFALALVAAYGDRPAVAAAVVGTTDTDSVE